MYKQPSTGLNQVLNQPKPFLSASEAVAADCGLPLANTNAVIAYAADPERTHVISGVAWSYDDTPTGRITIEYEGHLVFDIDITQGGPGFIPFSPPKAGRQGLALTITLYAGGAGIIGKLNVLGHWME